MERNKIIYGLTGLTAISLAGCHSPKKETAQPLRPNIIFILADDLGYGALGSYGQKLIKTPNLDKMAEKGIRLTQHYCGTSVSAPSRCILMTGMHGGHAYIRGNHEDNPYGQLQLPDSILTVADLLKEAGYTTGCIGKWGMGVENTTGDPAKHGYDLFYGYYCQVHAHNSFPEYLYRNGQKEYLKNKVVYMPKDHWTRGLGSYSTNKVEFSNDLFCDEALKFIDSNKNKPFFLYLPFTLPHNNGEALPGQHNEVPSLGIYEEEAWTPDQKAYAAMITRLDSFAGKIMEHLQELKIDSNTLVIFTSDNGGDDEDIFMNNAGLRGKKRDLFEGGIREPFIAYWPGKINAGRVSDHPSAFWDFMPTACELAGITPPNTDGISYVNELLGKPQAKHDFLYWEIKDGKKPHQALRMDDWKAVIENAGNETDTIQLYDLAKDTFEKKDISAEHPDVVSKMKQIMIQEHKPSFNFPFKREGIK